MGESDQQSSSISDEWLLKNLPFISFYCENDALYSMRFLSGPDPIFGYDLNDFLDKKRYFAASAILPEDLDIMDAHAEQAVAGGRPVVSRIRVATTEGEPVQLLIASQAVIGEGDQVLGLAGVGIDLRQVPALQGPPGLLSELHIPAVPRPRAKLTGTFDAAWVIEQLPLQSFLCRNDESFTIVANRGSLEELLGYPSADFRGTAANIKPWSVLFPDDQEASDAYFELAGSGEGQQATARIRLVDKSSNLAPVLVFAAGAKPPGSDEIMICGGVLNVSHIPALQGDFKLLDN